MNDQQLQRILAVTEIKGRSAAKKELVNRLQDLHRPIDIATEVMVWLNESELDKLKNLENQ